MATERNPLPTKIEADGLPSTNNWPSLSSMGGYDPWWSSMGEVARDEYIAAFKDILTAELNAEGALETSTRTFRFWTDVPEHRQSLTRLDWVSPSDETFAFAFEPDEALRALSEADPKAAAAKLARLFASPVANELGNIPYTKELHALAVQNFFQSHGRTAQVRFFTDMETGRTIAETEDEGPLAPLAVNLPPYLLVDFPLEGERSDFHLCMGEYGDQFEVALPSSYRSYTPAVIKQIATEANAILAKYGHDEIRHGSINLIVSQIGFTPSTTMLEGWRKKPTERISAYPCSDDSIDVDAPVRLKPEQTKALRHLAGLTEFMDGAIITPSATYEIKHHPHFPHSKVARAIYRSGQEEPVLIFDNDFPLDGSEESVASLKSAYSRSVNNLPPAEVKGRTQLLMVICQAVLEIGNARMAAAQIHEHVELSFLIFSRSNGIQIQVGEMPTFQYVPATPIFGSDFHDDDWEVGGHRLQCSEYLAPSCELLGASMMQSAVHTFNELGVQDIQPLIELVDKHISVDPRWDDE